MSGRVSVPCWHATPVANAPWKPLIIGEGQARYKGHEKGGKSDWFGSHCWSRIRMSFKGRSQSFSFWIYLCPPLKKEGHIALHLSVGRYVGRSVCR